MNNFFQISLYNSNFYSNLSHMIPEGWDTACYAQNMSG